MQKLSSTEKGWTAIVAAFWLVALFALIFILPTRYSADGAQPYGNVKPAGSLQAMLKQITPPSNDAVAAQIVDLRYVYDEETLMILPVCKNDPKPLLEQKKEISGEYGDKINFDNGENFIVQFGQKGPSGIEAIPESKMNLCPEPFVDGIDTAQMIPVFWDGGKWNFGIRQQP
ncbi:hypothetical protein [Corynebacterium aquatimens]|uniref:Uncharacterized protein n=1 Tax=Corynebacterium aquatimens TaxID=1190508 RepID=A0A931GY17_9CORY|nr:hypothetical protein [Corynebacterium aquatimens]MBG6123059.1 hypothetical protein [Corynebacterium aquatimens]WJY66607.1 hypothetical protein CAQUA_09600 [Corynebacterium aquatimens]